jgi:pimeloyl-ACP methyl ester carboxylesterase
MVSSFTLLCVGALQFILPLPSHGLLIPGPTGDYAVAVNIAKLVDESRTDPYDPNHGKRNVMISLYYPVIRSECEQMCAIKYMPPRTAAYTDRFLSYYGVYTNNTFEQFELEMCCKPSAAAVSAATAFPLVLFQGGLGGTRLMYGAMTQNLAGAGYAVASIDSTYDSLIVEYPDGTYTPGYNFTTYWNDTALYGALQDVHVQDAQFVLTQLGKTSIVSSLIPGASCAFDTSQVGFYGHSFGGATAIAALQTDPRIVGAMNLDGSQWRPALNTSKPALLFGSTEPAPHNRTTDASWRDTWDHLTGWKRELGLRNAVHTTFGDSALLVKLLGWPKNQTAGFVGTLDGRRVFEIQTTYITAFMDFVLCGRESGLLDGASEEYPEVLFE